MTWSAVGSFLQAGSVGGGTISLNNQAIGDLILLSADSIDSGTNYVNGISGGGCTWTQIGTTFTGSVNTRIATIWAGTVTTTGAQTATYTVTGGGPTIRAAGNEFSSTVGSWSLDVQANLDSAGTSNWPTLNPAGTGELYFGFAINDSSAVAGSTSGYTYKVTANGHGCAWNTNVSASSAPVWADSSQAFGSMILVKESGTSVSINGIGASVTVNGGQGSASGAGAVTGIGASVTVNGGPGTLSAAVNITGIGASITVAGGPGTLSAAINITGQYASVAVNGGQGAASGAGAVTGIGASITVAGGPGTLSAAVNITGIGASITVAGGQGSVSGSTSGLPGRCSLSQDIVYNVYLSQSTGTVTFRQQVIGSVTLSQEIVDG